MVSTISRLCLCLVALAVAIQSLPMTITDNLKNGNNETHWLYRMQNNFMAHDRESTSYTPTYRKIMQRRHVPDFIDGSIQQPRTGGINGRRVFINDQCFVEYDGQLLSDGNIIQVRKKLYKVERCSFERVFHACGPNLLLLLNAVCRAVEKHNATPIRTASSPTTTTMTMTTEIQSSNRFQQHGSYFNGRRLHPRASKAPRVITESCCENVCTIQELTRYCHR